MCVYLNILHSFFSRHSILFPLLKLDIAATYGVPGDKSPSLPKEPLSYAKYVEYVATKGTNLVIFKYELVYY